MSGQIFVGTSGYSYSDWVGPFYPEGTKQRDFLDVYTKAFRMVELNFSYYRQPEPSMLDRMIEVSPDGFLFAIKAYKSITHEVTSGWQKDAETYRTGISPLVKAERL